MDFISHATLGATLAIVISGNKTPEIAIQGAILGTLPDILGVPITEGYHLIKNKFNIFKKRNFNKIFNPGTTHRWEKLPNWVISYYQLLHLIWFALLFLITIYFLYPSKLLWCVVFYLSHPFIDLFLHKDEKGKRFKRAIRPFWPSDFSIQLVQWSDIYFWTKIPLLPLLFQLLFWLWFLQCKY